MYPSDCAALRSFHTEQGRYISLVPSHLTEPEYLKITTIGFFGRILRYLGLYHRDTHIAKIVNYIDRNQDLFMYQSDEELTLRIITLLKSANRKYPERWAFLAMLFGPFPSLSNNPTLAISSVITITNLNDASFRKLDISKIPDTILQNLSWRTIQRLTPDQIKSLSPPLLKQHASSLSKAQVQTLTPAQLSLLKNEIECLVEHLSNDQIKDFSDEIINSLTAQTVQKFATSQKMSLWPKLSVAQRGYAFRCDEYFLGVPDNFLHTLNLNELRGLYNLETVVSRFTKEQIQKIDIKQHFQSCVPTAWYCAVKHFSGKQLFDCYSLQFFLELMQYTSRAQQTELYDTYKNQVDPLIRLFLELSLGISSGKSQYQEQQPTASTSTTSFLRANLLDVFKDDKTDVGKLVYKILYILKTQCNIPNPTLVIQTIFSAISKSNETSVQVRRRVLKCLHPDRTQSHAKSKEILEVVQFLLSVPEDVLTIKSS